MKFKIQVTLSLSNRFSIAEFSDQSKMLKENEDFKNYESSKNECSHFPTPIFSAYFVSDLT